jgi:hypothetical protein
MINSTGAWAELSRSIDSFTAFKRGMFHVLVAGSKYLRRLPFGEMSERKIVTEPSKSQIIELQKL